MDPLTALSLAGTVVQFVDFSSKIFARSKQLYESSSRALTVNEEIEKAVQELSNLTIKLQRPQNDPVLDELCVACRKISAELLARLNALKVKERGQRWESFRQAIRGAWSENDIEALMKRLTTLREALGIHILVKIRENYDLESSKTAKRFDQVDLQTKAILDALLDIRSAVSKNVTDQTITLTEILHHSRRIETAQSSTTRCIILQRLEAVASADNKESEGTIEVDDAVSALARKEWKDEKLSVEEGILDSLHFPTRANRHMAISEVHHETFRWIFDARSTHNVPWSNFDSWLRKGKGVYWINGKAGSGKSTLTRYIYDSPQTRQRLQEWAGNLPLCIAGFFFWNSGSIEQRSQTGLIRSLLYEVLKDYQELIPIVLPGVWVERFVQEIRPSKKRGPPNQNPTLPHDTLLSALRTLISQKIIPIKLCFFIDGLDEFEGNHDEMAELFNRIASNADVKVCLSSRPLLALSDAFSSCPSLRLQDLSFKDIRNYTSDLLQNNQFFQTLYCKEPERAPALIEEIVSKANGVFLWVVLAVKSLLDGLKGRDTITDLRRRLSQIPADLDNLYQHMMLSGIEPFYETKASEVFQILRAARETGSANFNQTTLSPWASDNDRPLTTLELSLTGEEDRILALKAKITPFATEEIKERCTLIEDRLKIWCAGLVEVQAIRESRFNRDTRREELVDAQIGAVQYLHRTVRDYLEQEGVWETLVKKTTNPKFEPNDSLLQSCVLQLKLHRGVSPRLVAHSALKYALQGQSRRPHDYVALLDEIEKVMTRRVRGVQPGHWAAQLLVVKDKRTGAAIREDQDTFASFSVQYGLFGYLVDKLETNKAILTEKPGKPLLAYAVDSTANPDIVRLLLENGADPNQSFRGQTVWERLLHSTYELHGSGRKTLQNCLAICMLFAGHGAKYDSQCFILEKTRPPHMPEKSRVLPASSIIFYAFGAALPRETDELLRLLECNRTDYQPLSLTIVNDEAHSNADKDIPFNANHSSRVRKRNSHRARFHHNEGSSKQDYYSDNLPKARQEDYQASVYRPIGASRQDLPGGDAGIFGTTSERGNRISWQDGLDISRREAADLAGSISKNEGDESVVSVDIKQFQVENSKSSWLSTNRLKWFRRGN